MEDEFAKLGKKSSRRATPRTSHVQGGQFDHGAEPAVGGRLCGGGDRGAGVSPTPSTRVANNGTCANR